jgi:hypothetical protein
MLTAARNPLFLFLMTPFYKEINQEGTSGTILN